MRWLDVSYRLVEYLDSKWMQQKYRDNLKKLNQSQTYSNAGHFLQSKSDFKLEEMELFCKTFTTKTRPI